MGEPQGRFSNLHLPPTSDAITMPTSSTLSKKTKPKKSKTVSKTVSQRDLHVHD